LQYNYKKLQFLFAHMHSSVDLNDLIYVTAVTETGSLSAAARRLGVNHATVFRRIVQIEKELGVRLFEREAGRYAPTAAGAELATAGAVMQATAERSLLKVAGQDLRPSGPVYITTTDSIARFLLNPVIALCRSRYPQIALHIAIDNKMFNLTKREADIALRPSFDPPEHLLGKRIAPLAFAVYGSQGYLAERPVAELADHDWIALGESQEQHRTVQWLAMIKPLDQVGCRVDGFAAVGQACIDGLGLALLPCFMGDNAPTLRRITAPEPSVASELWLLTHPDLRNTARIKVVFDLLGTELGKRAHMLSGRFVDADTKLGG
jgi:DNA-binding transcriptional LysR family regulator